MLHKFDDFTVDIGRYELRNGKTVISVEPRVFDLIAHFASNPGNVLSVESLIENVWDGRIVSDATISSCVKNARKALGDTGTPRRYIETVRGRGFRFTATVTSTSPVVENDNSGDVSVSALTLSQESSRPDDEGDPSILILPFRCLFDDSSIAHAVAGIPNDLGSILTRVPLLKQSLEGSRYVGREIQPTAREIHEELSVDFVLDGSAQQLGDQVRTNVQLANAKTGMRIWAETFDHSLSDINWQTRCVHAIIGKLEPQLQRAMHHEFVSAGSGVSARQLYLEATGLLIKNGWNHVAFPVAQQLLRKSRSLNSEFALAPSLLSMLMGFGDRMGLMPRSEDSASEALEAAEAALNLDNMDSTVLGLTGCCLADIGFPDRGESLLRNAIDLNSSNSQAWVALGAVRLGQGDKKDAVAKLAHGIEISPLDSRLSIWGAVHAAALLAAGDAPEARTVAKIACSRHDKTYPARITLAAARLVMGDTDKAKIAMDEARRIKPDLNGRQIGCLIGKKLSAELLKAVES